MASDCNDEAPNPAPMYILLIMAICLCMYFFFIGVVCVRLWFYKGALAPEPEKFMIIPLHHKKKLLQQQRCLTTSAAHHNRYTVFPNIKEPHTTYLPANPFSDEHAVGESTPYLTTLPAINVQGADDEEDSFEDFEDPTQVRKYIAEERRISRLPAFDQDDCGDGTDFPDVAYALTPVEGSQVYNLNRAKTHLQLGLQKVLGMGKWLTIDNSYNEMHEARNSLLARKQMKCVQVEPDARPACEELLDEVVKHLCKQHPDHFRRKTQNLRNYIRNELVNKEYSIVKPFERHPLELCARLTVEDFCVFIKDEFTRKWYLKASATLFPAGYEMHKYIGRSINEIIDHTNNPMALWYDLPDILDLQHTTGNLFIRITTFIQTRPAKSPLSDALFIQRPVDFFSGNMSSLQPSHLYIRREHQTFRLLPTSGAIVMSTRTEFKKLTEVNNWLEKRDLMDEVTGWDEFEARFKGRELWIRAVRGHCEGRDVFHDDRTVIDAGNLTAVGEN